MAIENIIQRMSEGGLLMLLINALHGSPIPAQYSTNDNSGTEPTLEQKSKNIELCFTMLEDSEVTIPSNLLKATGKTTTTTTHYIYATIFIFLHIFSFKKLQVGTKKR